MNYTNNRKSTLHRPGRSIKTVAPSIASGGVEERKNATANPSRPSSALNSSPNPHQSSSSVLYRCPSSNIVTAGSPVSILQGSHAVKKPCKPLITSRSTANVAAFNVRTLRQMGQQAALALTLDKLRVDICCVSETRLGEVPRTEISAPTLRSRYWLRCSSDQSAVTTGQAGVGVVLSAKAEASLIDWIPLNSRLCAVRLESSIKVNASRSSKRCLFVVSAYAPTNCSTDLIKDQFYSDFRSLLSRARSSDIVIVAGDMNAQVGQLGTAEINLGGKFSYGDTRTENGDRLMQACADHHLFLTSTSFRHKKRHLTTWRAPNGQYWTQIDHIAVGYRWRGSFLDCRSYWNTYLESDHALVLARFRLRFPAKPQIRSLEIDTGKLNEPDIKEKYQKNLRETLSVTSSSYAPEEDSWKNIAGSILDAASAVCGSTQAKRNKSWISDRSMGLLGVRRELSRGSSCTSARRKLTRELKRSLVSDRETWWMEKASEMESAFSTGNLGKLFSLIRSTGRKPKQVSENIKSSYGGGLYSKEQRLSRWAEYFEEQLSWPEALINVGTYGGNVPVWEVNMEPPSVTEVRTCLLALKTKKATGPDRVDPILLKEGGEALAVTLSKLFEDIWLTEKVPPDWGASIIVPIFKKGDQSICSNYRGISLTPVISRVFASLLMHRLTQAREANIREQQAGFSAWQRLH